MKLIRCVVRPHQLRKMIDALDTLQVSGVTVSPTSGRARLHERRPSFYRGCKHEVSLLPEILIDVAAHDFMVDDVVRLLMETAGSDQMGDGRIFVMPVEHSYVVRARQGRVA